MKRLLPILLLLSVATMQAATVHFALTNFNITTATNSIIVTPTNGPVLNSPFLQVGVPIRISTTTGQVTTNLLSGVYTLQIYGITYPRPLLFTVPNDSGTYEITQLLTNGFSFSTTNPPYVTALRAGANITATTNVAAITVALSSNVSPAGILTLGANSDPFSTSNKLVLGSAGGPLWYIGWNDTGMWFTNVSDGGVYSFSSDGVFGTSQVSANLAVQSPSFVGSFTGNGSNLTNFPTVNLSAPAAGSTAGIQQMIDSLPKASNVAGIGGGAVTLGPGFYYLSTNIWIPGKWPFKLHLKGAGDQATFLIYTGRTNTAAIRCEANNAGSVVGLTNNINLEWEGTTLSAVTNSTNFLFALENVNFVKVHDNVLANYECLTNGNGIYAMCFEGNVPTQVPGTAGISLYWGHEPNSGQGTFDIHNNKFYGLACAFHNGGVRGTFCNNHIFNCGGYYNGSVFVGHTNAYRFDFSQAQQEGRAGITTGAAIVNLSQGDTIIADNHFLICGLAYYQDSLTISQVGAVNGPIVLTGNNYESCQYRVASWDQGDVAIAGYEFGLPGPANVNGGNGFPPDVVVTNSATKVQPNAVVPTTDIVTGFRSYIQSANAAGGGYLAVNGLLACSNSLAVDSGGITWPTNSTLPPGSTTTIRAWLSVTNNGGKIGKIPVYY